MSTAPSIGTSLIHIGAACRNSHSSRWRCLCTARVEAESSRIGLDLDVRETRPFQPAAQVIGIHRHERVVNMKQAHAQTLPAIYACERAAGLQHTADFLQQAILQLR